VVACNWISGGAMLGNWAMGNCTMETTPTITMMIEMTIATMGRLMKNFAIAAGCAPGQNGAGVGVAGSTGAT
jgi:hypothetical protein